MDNEDFSKTSGEKQPNSNGLRELLESLRTIVVASLALVISLGEWISKKFSSWQIQSEEQAKILDKQRAEQQEKIERSLREEQRALREEKRKADEQAKIAQERRDEERAIREAERKAKEQKFNLKKILYPSLSTISTVALLIGVSKLAPVAK